MYCVCAWTRKRERGGGNERERERQRRTYTIKMLVSLKMKFDKTWGHISCTFSTFDGQFTCQLRSWQNVARNGNMNQFRMFSQPMFENNNCYQIYYIKVSRKTEWQRMQREEEKKKKKTCTTIGYTWFINSQNMGGYYVYALFTAYECVHTK